MNRHHKSNTRDSPFERERIDDEATAWVVRSQNGLSPAETKELEAWLSQDERHAERFYRHSRTWSEMTDLQRRYPHRGEEPDPDLLAPNVGQKTIRLIASRTTMVAAAAAIALFAGVWFFTLSDKIEPHASALAHRTVKADTFIRHFLSDGSLVELNAGAEIAVGYTPKLRKLRLLEGEAHFEVAKNADRPFLVEAGGTEFQAVGTAFNIHLSGEAVELLVTEGKVKLRKTPASQASSTFSDDTPPPLQSNDDFEEILEASQRAIIATDISSPSPSKPRIESVSQDLIAQRLAWKAPEPLVFESTPLRKVLDAFNQRNFRQIHLADPQLADMKIEARFRSDNVDGLVKMLSLTAGLKAEREDGGRVITLQ